jgi:ribosome maturation factor RimP
MDAASKVERIITPSLEAMGYRLVRVKYIGSTQPVLQIMAERSTDGAMTVDDCAEVSRAVSALLDVEDPIAGPYNLEVSSPGLDRPLVRLDDFDRFAGFEAKVELREPMDGRKRFRGRLLGVADGNVRMEFDGDAVSLPYDNVGAAKLVITDDLIAASLKERNSQME